MSFEDVLIHIPDSGAWPRHCVQAARLAQLFGSRVTGIEVFEPLPMVSPAETPALLLTLQQEASEQVAAARGAGPSFAARMKELGVEQSDWTVAEGQIPATLALAGGTHDLLVLGVGESPSAMPESLAEVIVAARMPCLVVPGNVPPGRFSLDKVAIGWNGSIEAMRAAHAALPLLRRAEHVVVLAGETRDYSSVVQRRPEFDIVKYLERHGIRAETHRMADDAVHEAATALHAGLLVMGAYGRSRFSERILGGATRRALWNATLPLFLQH